MLSEKLQIFQVRNSFHWSGKHKWNQTRCSQSWVVWATSPRACPQGMNRQGGHHKVRATPFVSMFIPVSPFPTGQHPCVKLYGTTIQNSMHYLMELSLFGEITWPYYSDMMSFWHFCHQFALLYWFMVNSARFTLGPLQSRPISKSAFTYFS